MIQRVQTVAPNVLRADGLLLRPGPAAQASSAAQANHPLEPSGEPADAAADARKPKRKAAEGAADFGLQVDFRQLTLHVKGRTIIGGIDGRVARGRATAIMGSSGAGKTSLLNVLSGRASYGVGGGVRSDAHKGTTLVSLFESAARLGLS